VVSRRSLRFVVIGDTTLDITIRGPEPVPGTDRPATSTLSPGGQGANVAVRLARRGARVRLVTALGTDFAGRQLEERITAEGVEIANLGTGPTGIVFVFLGEDADDGESGQGDAGERAMLSDRASLPATRWSAAWRDALQDADWIHVSGYPLADVATGSALADLVASRRDGQRLSIGGGSFASPSPAASAVKAAAPELVLFDRSEAAAVLGLEPEAAATRSSEELATALTGALRAIAVVTDGASGAAVATDEGAWRVGGPPRPQVDTTGAGDAYAAAVILGLAIGAWPPAAADLRQALEEAGEIGGQVAGLVGAQARAPIEGTP
jgi:ribokinase